MDTVDNKPQKSEKTAILGVFAKQPLTGQCKTRLCPPLSLAEAAEFYACCLRETVTRLQSAASSYQLAICYAGERSWFEQEFPGVTLVPQQGDDLGARMATALHDFLQQGYRQAVLVGSDSPDLPLALIEQAISALQRADVVLAPAIDGGYLLIGASCHHPSLFSAIEWSTAQVFSTSWQRIEQQNISAVQLGSWEDLDDLPSLRRFLQRSPGTATAVYLRKHLNRYFSSGE